MKPVLHKLLRKPSHVYFIIRKPSLTEGLPKGFLRASFLCSNWRYRLFLLCQRDQMKHRHIFELIYLSRKPIKYIVKIYRISFRASNLAKAVLSSTVVIFWLKPLQSFHKFFFGTIFTEPFTIFFSFGLCLIFWVFFNKTQIKSTEVKRCPNSTELIQKSWLFSY